MIFRGSIKQVRKGRVNQKDSYLDITAADGDEAYNFSMAALTLAAGTTITGSIESIIQRMARGATKSSPTGAPGGQEITQGYLPEFSTNPRVRGRVFFGRARPPARARGDVYIDTAVNQYYQCSGGTWRLSDRPCPRTTACRRPSPLTTPTSDLAQSFTEAVTVNLALRAT